MAKKKKSANRKEGGPSRSGYVSLSTLGEELRRKNPDMMRQVEALKRNGFAPAQAVDVLHDLMPYRWTCAEAFEEGVERTARRQYSEAVSLLERVIEEDPQAFPAYHLLGFAAGCLGDDKREIENYRKAIKLRPDYPQVYYNLGVAYLRLGKEKKALATFRHAVPLGQDFDTADFWLSFCFDRLGQNTCVVSPGNAGSPDAGTVFSNACLWVGNAFLEYALHIPARHAYKKAVRSWPDSAEAHYELGAIHLKRLRNPQRAERYLEKAEQLFVQNNDLHRATLVHQRLRPREKVLDPDKAAQDWLKEGVRLQHLGRYQAAIDAYKMAISFKPNFVDAFYNLGIAYGSLEEVGLPLIPKAIWAFKQAIRAKSDFVHAYIGLGASHLKLREFEEAIGVLESALKLNSQEAQAFYYLGQTHRLMGRPAEALDYFRQAVSLKPDSVQVQFYRGLTLLECERYEDACEVFQEVVRIKPDFADGHFMLGGLYTDKVVDPEKSAAHLKKAEKLFIKMEDYNRAAQARQLLAHQPA